MLARKYPLREIADVLIQHRWIILVPLAIGAALAPVLARYAPERYRSEALIVVVPQQVPDAYVQPTVSETVAERLPALTEEILSRTRLESLIQKLELYPAERSRWVMEDVVNAMRGDITTSAVGRTVNSFRVSYESDDPQKAQLVTQELARFYKDQNTESRALQADQTSEFLESQLADAKAQLVEQEKRLEAYRTANAGQLPSQLQGNLQAIQNTNLQLQSVNESMNRAQERRLLIERQIADTLAVPIVSSQTASASADTPAPLSAARQLEVAQARLTLILQRNTPDHPDVVSLNRTIEELNARVKSEASGEVAPVAARLVTPEEAAQQRRLLDLRAELDVVDFQLATNRKEQARLQQAINDYQAKVDSVPTRESELVELTRDYSTMQAAYSSLLAKRGDSVIAANLERRLIGEQFDLVDEASLPQRPFNQRERMAIMASGAVVGLLLGLLAVGVLEYRDSSYRSAEEVLAGLELPVLASIPLLVSERERQTARRRGLMRDIGGCAVVVASVVVLVVWRLQQ